ncbi:hypothetical protein Nepgr_032370 [Nepenthes gracilis]|uniref:Amino acid transporter transmembrane domain-containing protein n=1 Tax=Nepenthes gracilis TaxID=150966 RepID=A0AAD3TKP9_NEPGR|nr:hypothetical protein Nepgr_032370 [Nepenthes gracilis]
MKWGKRDEEAVSPLLPEIQSPVDPGPKGASLSSAVFNISTTMIGAGIMSIPATFKVLGIIPALVIIMIVAFLGDISGEFLLRYTHSGESTTYSGLMAESFGRFGSLALQICVMITSLGCLVIYLIIIGDVLTGNLSGDVLHTGILQEWFGFHWWTSRTYALLFVVFFVMLPLVLLRRIDSLRYTSALSILLGSVFVVMCSIMAIYALWGGKSQRLRLVPDISSQGTLFSLFTTIPVFMTAFGYQINVHPIRAELGEPSDMRWAIRISLVICATFYFTIGFFGYLLFGDSIMADMLVNFDEGADSAIGVVINDVVRLSYAVHLMLVFPLINYALRANLDELLFSRKPILATDTSRFLSLTCSLLAITCAIAISIPDVWYCFQFLGSTTVVCLTFIFPASISVRDIHGISSRRDKIVAVVLILLAAGTSIIAISSNLYRQLAKLEIAEQQSPLPPTMSKGAQTALVSPEASSKGALAKIHRSCSNNMQFKQKAHTIDPEVVPIRKETK